MIEIVAAWYAWKQNRSSVKGSSRSNSSRGADGVSDVWCSCLVVSVNAVVLSWCTGSRWSSGAVSRDRNGVVRSGRSKW